MRRSVKPGQARPVATASKMNRELDWVLDEWRTCAPEDRLKLVIAKILYEEKLPVEPRRAV
jgi:hypothetical protein